VITNASRRVLTRSQHLPLPTLLSNLQEAYWEPCGFWTGEEAQNLGLYKLPLFWAAPTFLNYAEVVFRISMGRGGNNLLTGRVAAPGSVSETEPPPFS